MTVVGFDPLRAAIEASADRALAELDQADELGRLTPELAAALERFAAVLDVVERESVRFGLAPRRE